MLKLRVYEFLKCQCDGTGISDCSPFCRRLWNENQFVNHVNKLHQNDLVHVHCMEWNKVSLFIHFTTKQWEGKHSEKGQKNYSKLPRFEASDWLIVWGFSAESF